MPDTNGWWVHPLSKIFFRSWENLQEKWLDYIPSINTPGSKPESSILDSTTLLSNLGQILDTAPCNLIDHFKNERATILHEAIFSLHKAANVLAGAQIHICVVEL